MKRIFAVLFLALVALCVFAQIAPLTIPDITGGGGVTTIAAAAATASVNTNGGAVSSFLIIAAPTNSATSCSTTVITGCPRIGDSTVSTSRGDYLLPGQSTSYPETSGTRRYNLSQWYFLVQSGDKVTFVGRQ